jgi:methyltransferase-like protein/2-polyprenyl-3-methyl-5-hydroxy-6-metoxy-1,4-benzoquinol methylase
MPDSTPYDRVPYSNQPFQNTRPHYLATVGSLYGMTPASPSRCRVLELGCGAGGNIVPMAYHSPQSEFVGVDLSGRSITAGQAMIERLGLSNVSLQHRDIMNISDADGKFDYIIAHGVFSWVPAAVRDKIWSVFEDNLSPQGIAYVSYNALPGAHLRDLARSMLLYHVRHIDDSAAKTAQARTLMKSLAEFSAPDSVFGVVLRDQADRIKSLPNHVFIHDDLDELSTPFFLHQVVDAAAAHGLQYLADSDFPILGLHGRSTEICTMLSSVPEDQAAVREQYLDFIDGRPFRTSLFCHQNVMLNRPAGPDRIRAMHLSGSLSAGESDIDPATEDVVVFKTQTGEALRTNQPLGKAALLVLSDVAPQAIAFDELEARAMARLGNAAPAPSATETGALLNLLFQAVRNGLLDAHHEAPALTGTISKRPKASGLARFQLTMGTDLITNLLHGAVLCEGDMLRRFMPLVDGTRDVGQLRDDLERVLTSESALSEPTIAEATKTDAVQRSLNVMAKLALLEC